MKVKNIKIPEDLHAKLLLKAAKENGGNLHACILGVLIKSVE